MDIESMVKEWIGNLSNFQVPLSERARRGDTAALNRYSILLGRSLSSITVKIMNSEEFSSLSNKQKASIVRHVIGNAILNSNDMTRSMAYETMIPILKNKGYIFNPEQGERPNDRIKALIAGSLNWIVTESNHEAGVNVLKGGTQQMVNNGVRSTLINTSEKVFRNTGRRLEGKRLVTSSTACEFCRSFSGKTFSIHQTMDEAEFHDYCDCLLVII